jgi:hypothetical protein
MLTFSQQQTLFQDLSIDTSDEALTFGKLQINIGLHLLESELGIHHVEETRTGTTTVSAGTIQLPENCIRPKTFYVTTADNIRHVAEEIYDEDQWQAIQSRSYSQTNDILELFFARRGTIEYYPKSATALTWTLIYEAESKDLQYDDYTTGTIANITNGDETVDGNSPLWTSVSGSLVGRYLRVNADGQWYEIASVTDADTLELVKKYQGTSIAAGTSAYTIGEMPRTPGPTHHIPVYYALWHYFEGFKKDGNYGGMYKSQYEQYMQWAKSTYGRRYSSQVIPNQRHIKKRFGFLDPNTNRHIT